MLRIEVYMDTHGKLRAHTYSDNGFKEKSLDQVEIMDLIRRFYRLEIKGYRDYHDAKNVSIYYNNGILNINEYDKILNNNEFNKLFMPIFSILQKSYEINKVNQSRKREVVRKNKYSKKKLIAIGLATFVIAGSTVYANKLPKITHIDEPSISISTDVEKEPNSLKSGQEDNNTSVYSEIPEIFIEYENRTSSEKALRTIQNYKDVIDKYSKVYGLDPQLVLAIATQESGDHYGTLKGGSAIGLMQVEKSVWAGNCVTAYNFETNSWEKVKVSLKGLSDLDYNVRIGCMIFQANLRDTNYNVLAALTEYNMGCGNLKNKILAAYCKENNLEKQKVLDDQNDIGWLDYRNYGVGGDKHYIENVLSYYGDECDIENIRPDGSQEMVKITRNLQKMY